MCTLEICFWKLKKNYKTIEKSFSIDKILHRAIVKT